MRPAFITLGLLAALSARSAHGGEPAIVFDNRPEMGIPREALAQEFRKLSAEEQARAVKGYPFTFPALTAGTIQSVRIRYFNRQTWASEKEAREYVAEFLRNKSSGVSTFQVWSEFVLLPEIECIVDFTAEHRKKLSAEHKACREGRLLLWHTEACFRVNPKVSGTNSELVPDTFVPFRDLKGMAKCIRELKLHWRN
jgi:hypothetical protein